MPNYTLSPYILLASFSIHPPLPFWVFLFLSLSRFSHYSSRGRGCGCLTHFHQTFIRSTCHSSFVIALKSLLSLYLILTIVFL